MVGWESACRLRSDPQEVELRSFKADVYGGIVEGRLTTSPLDMSALATADIRWRDIDLGSLPVEMPEAAVGVVSGRLRVEGGLVRPEGDLEISWLPAETMLPCRGGSIWSRVSRAVD